MTRSKAYRYGKHFGRTYFKNAGGGWECGFVFDSRVVFIGNFIHSREAQLWFALMNREVRNFSRKYAVGQRCSAIWYAHFLRNHLYKCYYGFLDRLFARYRGDYQRAFTRDLRQYQRLRRDWRGSRLQPALRAA